MGLWQDRSARNEQAENRATNRTAHASSSAQSTYYCDCTPRL